MISHSSVILAAISGVASSLLVAAQSPPPAAKPPAASEPAAPAAETGRFEIQPVDVKWLDRIPKDDRAAFDELLGYAPPDFASDLQWIGGEQGDWNALRGRVVVIQSFTTANTAGRGWPARVANALKDFGPNDVRIIALHTPEQADGAKEFLAKKAPPEGVTVAIDGTGDFCDALMIYKHPANLVIDRNGVVRFAALNVNGLEQAVKQVVAEPFQPDFIAAQRESSSDAASVADAGFPAFTGKIDSAIDVRGKRAPEFHVEQWLNGEAPDAKGKIVLVDFWATWCGPCVASISHMNELATKFRDDVVCVGLTDENKSAFDGGMAKLKGKGITLDFFKYPVAIDSSAAMYKALQIRGIPHGIVMDRNWVVRWQGHPASLDAGTLQKIVDADKAAASGGSAGGSGDGAKPAKAKTATGKRKTWT